MKWISPALVCFLAVGCSSITKHFAETPAPSFTVDKDLVVKAQNRQVKDSITRGPASVETEQAEIDGLLSETKNPEGRALRRIYFSLLYQQYHQLSFLMNEKTELKFCPQFHSDKATMDQELRVSAYKGELFKSMESHAVYFPESNLVQKKQAKVFLSNIKSELTTLCDEGITDDYYKLENIVSYYSGRESFHRSPDSMTALMKIPVFAHLYYLKTVEAPFSVAQTEFNKHEKELIQRTRTNWVHHYVVEVRKKRLSIVQSAMLTNN